eukprot:372459-Prymnesium_polylepis.1
MYVGHEDSVEYWQSRLGTWYSAYHAMIVFRLNELRKLQGGPPEVVVVVVPQITPTTIEVAIGNGDYAA